MYSAGCSGGSGGGTQKRASAKDGTAGRERCGGKMMGQEGRHVMKWAASKRAARSAQAEGESAKAALQCCF